MEQTALPTSQNAPEAAADTVSAKALELASAHFKQDHPSPEDREDPVAPSDGMENASETIADVRQSTEWQFRERRSNRTLEAMRTQNTARSVRLLLEAASNFCSIERPRKEDLAVFREFFTQLIGACDTVGRRSLSATIATNAYIPRVIILYLALDELQVAAPILLLSPILKETDIVALARKLKPAQLQVLCRRNDLTPAATLSLLANGGELAAAALARNTTAPRSEPAENGEGAEKQNTVRTGKAETGEKVDIAKVDRLKELLALAARGGRLGRSHTVAPAAYSRPTPVNVTFGKEVTRQLVKVARTGDRKAVAGLIARQLGCPVTAIFGLISGDSVETLCMLLKGLGVDDLAASRLILLLRPMVGRSTEAMSRAVGLYRNINVEACRRFVETFSGGAEEIGTTSDAPPANLAAAISERRREIADHAELRPAPHQTAEKRKDEIEKAG